MSTHPQSLTPFPSRHTAFDGDMLDFRLPRNHAHSLNYPALTHTAHFHHLRFAEPEGDHPYGPYLRHANQFYASSTPAHVNQYNLTLWGPTESQMVPSLPTVVNDQRDTGPYCDNHVTFDFTGIGPNSPDRHLLIESEIRGLGYHLLDQPSTYWPLPPSSRATYSHYSSTPNDQNIADPFVLHHFPSQSFSPSSHHSTHPTTAGYLEPNTGFRLVSPRNSTISSRPRRGAGALEYGGLWIDEEELLNGLTEPDGKLNVHQCRWEEGRSSCHLWIKCDKSCINAHIQKWHRGKPGGDKLEADCAWSACGRTMLKESIARHIVSIHIGEMWECQGCGKEFARNDAYGRHSARLNSEACRDADVLITYSADVRVIDARAALDSGGRLRYADV